MAAGYFSLLWGLQVSGLSAGYADGGYNLSYTATSTGNSYGGLFFSMDYISEGIDRMMDVDRNSVPQGEDMANPWDWLYQLNKFNPLANVINGISTYITGYDTYGVKQNNTEATAQILLAIFPAGKLSSTTSSAASNLWRLGHIMN